MSLANPLPKCILSIPFLGKLITVGQMEPMPIDLDIVPDNQILRLQFLSIIFLILISFQEFALAET